MPRPQHRRSRRRRRTSCQPSLQRWGSTSLTRPRSFARTHARTHDTNTKRNRNRFPGWGKLKRLCISPQPPTIALQNYCMYVLGMYACFDRWDSWELPGVRESIRWNWLSRDGRCSWGSRAWWSVQLSQQGVNWLSGHEDPMERQSSRAHGPSHVESGVYTSLSMASWSTRQDLGQSVPLWGGIQIGSRWNKLPD